MKIIDLYKNNSFDVTKLLLSIAVSLYMFYYLSNLSDWHFIDNVNLIFHEAGHVVFGFFGDFIRTFGGTLMQLLVPTMCSLYFYKNRDYFSASLLLFWLSQNFFNVYIYSRDAMSMSLPLLGGDGVYHDWNHMLSSLNILRFTDEVASLFYIIGLVVLVFAVVYSIKFSIKNTNI